MERSQSKYNSELEINDLISESVKNAVFRRQQITDLEDTFSALSDEEAVKVAGGRDVTIAGGIIGHPFPPDEEAVIAGGRNATIAGGIIGHPFPPKNWTLA